MEVTEQDFWEASEDPDAYIAKYGYDRWQQVQNLHKQYTETLPMGESTHTGEQVARALKGLQGF